MYDMYKGEMMKKILTVLLSIAMIFALVGCSSSSGTSKCTICRKTATHTYQGSGYCTEHYKDAIAWSIKNVDKKRGY